MIRSAKELIEKSEKFSDTQELANALREIADSEEQIGPVCRYYLMESADHMDALYRALLEALRLPQPSAGDEDASNPTGAPSTIEMQPGERYVGVAKDADGIPLRHIILLPHKPAKRLSWRQAKTWASGMGAKLPNRIDALLLATVFPGEFLGREGWTSEEYGNLRTCAWVYGDNQAHLASKVKSAKCTAVTVRYIDITDQASTEQLSPPENKG